MWYFGVIYNTAVGVKTVVNNTDYPVRFFGVSGSKFLFLAHQTQKIGCRNRILTTIFALLVDSCTRKIHHAYAGNFHRILKTKENTFVGTFFRRQFQEVFTVKAYFALRHLERWMPG